MARVMLATSAEKGHVHPAVGLAQWLRRRGHEVGWLVVPGPTEQVRALGVEVLELPAGGGAHAIPTSGAELAAVVRDPPALRAWIRGLLLDGVDGQVGPVRDLVRAWRPSVVAADGMLYAVAIAAHREGVPFAGVSSALTLFEPPGFDSELLRTVRGLAADRAALFARHGVPASFRTCEYLSPRLNVSFTTADLVGDAPPPPAALLAGPSVPPGPRGDEVAFPWDSLDPRRPLVYAAFGSQVWYQPDLLGAVAEACAGLDVQLVASAGGLAGTAWARGLPGDPLVVPYAPQRELLARAAAFVSHGGANSVAESLQAGVPMLLAPVCNDQPLQAFFVARAGAGRVVPAAELDVPGCRDALRALLHDGRWREGAARIRDAWRGRDGARAAAEHVARLAG